jgi:hypothetical protein
MQPVDSTDVDACYRTKVLEEENNARKLVRSCFRCSTSLVRTETVAAVDIDLLV